LTLASRELSDALPRFSRKILHAAEINVSGDAGHKSDYTNSATGDRKKLGYSKSIDILYRAMNHTSACITLR